VLLYDTRNICQYYTKTRVSYVIEEYLSIFLTRHNSTSWSKPYFL